MRKLDLYFNPKDTLFRPKQKTMKKILLLCMTVCASLTVFGQETPDQEGGKKKVTITKTWTDENGQERTITVIKEADDTPENADWLNSEDVQAPDYADIEIRERSNADDRDQDAFPWKDLPGELRIQLDDWSQEFEENWPEIENHIRKGTDDFFQDNDHLFFRQAFLGVITEPAEPGIRVKEIVQGSAAEKAGLQVGDVLMEVDGEALVSPAELSAVIRSHKPGDEAIVKLMRGDQAMTIPVVLGRRNPARMEWSEFTFPEWKGKNAHAKCEPKARLGVLVNDQEQGVNVVEVFSAGAAEAAGIREGDLIYEIEDTDIPDAKTLIQVIGTHQPGDQIQVGILRDGVRQHVSVTLSAQDRMGCCPPGCCQGRQKGESSDDRTEVESLEFGSQSQATLELKDLHIFPNPTRGEVQVAFRTETQAPVQVRILYASGRAFQVVELSGTDTFNETFNLGDQPAGNYTLLIEQDGEFLTRTIIRNE